MSSPPLISQELVRLRRPTLMSKIAPLLALPFVAVAAPCVFLANWLGGKAVSQRFASLIIPAAMKLQEKSMRAVKDELLKSLTGEVLDIGCADGQWLRRYLVKDGVTSVLAVEPNPHLQAKLKATIDALKIEFPDGPVITQKCCFAADLVGQQFDSIVFGNILCEVPDQKQFLLQVDALLKPGGRVYFIEHVRNPPYALVQDILNPVWSTITDGCNCNRDTLSEIERVWVVEHKFSLYSDAPSFLSKNVVGIARKARASTVAAL